MGALPEHGVCICLHLELWAGPRYCTGTCVSGGRSGRAGVSQAGSLCSTAAAALAEEPK